jgi:hypothetical protein
MNQIKLNIGFNIYPSHSVGFFIKSKKHKELGLYNTNLKFCSDYDLFYRMIVKKKMKGMSTKKKEVIGKFDMNGLSSKLNFIENYFFEMKVRYINKQNIIYLLFLFLIKILNYFKNRLLKL